MKLLGHLILSLASNLTAVLGAAYFLDGFEVAPTIKDFVVVAGLLTLINVFLRPILKFILTPVIILTFGLFNLILNAALLFALDFFSPSLTINGLKSLLYSTLIITAINLAIIFLAHRLSKKV